MMARKPLLLKEYLELDCEPSDHGFQCARRSADAGGSTIRCLIEAELRRCSSVDDSGRLVRSRSKNALNKISAVINAVKLLPFSSSSSTSGAGDGASLSRSFSKKIRGSFWKRKKAQREDVEEKRKAIKRVRDIVRLPSFDEEIVNSRLSFNSPSSAVSSRRSWSETASPRSDSLPLSLASSANLDDPSAAITEAAAANAFQVKEASPAADQRAEAGDDEAGGPRAACDRTPKEMEGNRIDSPDCCHSEEEKEQLSPVSVMDFPFDEEEEEERDDDSLPAFHDSLANIERTKMKLLQKIRRFENLAKLDPVNLQGRFEEEESSHVAPSEDEEKEDGRTKAWALLAQFQISTRVGPQRGCVDQLLFDFFIQQLSSPDDADHSRPYSTPSDEELLSTARDWVEGRRDVEIDDWLYGDAALREMEKNGRWRCFEQEEKELGMELEGVLLGRLLEEVVVDLVTL